MPLWVSILQAAEEWGVPPWEIAPGRSKTTWFARWQFVKREQVRADKEKAEEVRAKYKK